MRRHPHTGRALLILVNLDAERPVEARWPCDADPETCESRHDLMTGQTVILAIGTGQCQRQLAPAEVLCLDPDRSALERLEERLAGEAALPESVRRQRLQSLALNVAVRGRRTLDIGEIDPVSRRRGIG